MSLVKSPVEPQLRRKMRVEIVCKELISPAVRYAKSMQLTGADGCRPS